MAVADGAGGTGGGAIVTPSTGGPHDASSIRILKGQHSRARPQRLGLAAQRFEIEAFARREGFSVKSWHQDVQTGAGADALQLRPGLAAVAPFHGGNRGSNPLWHVPAGLGKLSS